MSLLLHVIPLALLHKLGLFLILLVTDCGAGRLLLLFLHIFLTSLLLISMNVSTFLLLKIQRVFSLAHVLLIGLTVLT